ncbi:MAG TPA: hypothetical protein PK014_06725 [Thermoanaerobaculia bacterium]|mgnify:CR=1 FL=1|nr:hypothetical protein [Thermoanaerobaculia bacterium]HUM29867.1 hypothetical protein [Thermoanaerobaculia bacterium]HXK68142.1 hypothetical protein [Thermoanaerobaculia bacterium]
MIPALFLASLLGTAGMIAPIQPGDLVGISDHGALVSDGHTVLAFRASDPSKGTILQGITSYLGKSYSVTSLSGSNPYVITGIRKDENHQTGFVTLFGPNETLLSSWDTGDAYPVAHYLKGATLYLALLRNEAPGELDLYLKEYTKEGGFVRDLMPPVSYGKVESSQYALALPYYTMGSLSDQTSYLVDPYAQTVYFVENGKVRDLSMKIKPTQLTPIVTTLALSSYVSCGKDTYAIFLGIRPTKKIVPYLVKVNDQGHMLTFVALESKAIYLLRGNGDTYWAKIFDPQNHAFGIQTLSCGDIQKTLTSK